MENRIVDLTALTDKRSGLPWKSRLILGVLPGGSAHLTARMRFVQLRGFRHALHRVQGQCSGHPPIAMRPFHSPADRAAIGNRPEVERAAS